MMWEKLHDDTLLNHTKMVYCQIVPRQISYETNITLRDKYHIISHNISSFFSRGHASVYLAVLVGLSVGLSLRKISELRFLH